MRKKEQLLDVYKTMNQIRKFEETAFEVFFNGEIYGSFHAYIGEEAIASSAMHFLSDADYVVSNHRGHGHCLAKTKDFKSAMAELMAKEAGSCKGRGGSMHISDISKGCIGANGIVGAGMPISTGAALAQKMRKTENITICFFGDGASNQGTFHESMNLASVWKLPLIFICENNEYGLSVPVEVSTSVRDIAVRSVGYDVPGEVVDGNDVIALLDAFEKAFDRARRGEGPSLIECKTYRWKGHWPTDPEVYRPKEEVLSWHEKCPIKRLRAYLIENKMATETELDEMENTIQQEMDEAVAYARSCPEPDPSTVMENVYFEG